MMRDNSILLQHILLTSQQGTAITQEVARNQKSLSFQDKNGR